ncbi:MAG: hypothetical protein M0012_02150 [Deltaproteobacteria bacterium]|nr:hypothetical protein [Deltaproteobacteria bacterium]
MNGDTIKYFTKIIKQAVLVFAGIFLFALVLNLIGNRFITKPAYKSKSKNGLIHKVFRAAFVPASAKPLKSAGLKDLFYLPGKKDKKFNSPFVFPLPRSSAGAGSVKNKPINFTGSAGNIDFDRSTANMPDFLKNIKFKGFPNKKNSHLSVIFIAGKIALIEIYGKRYYVHSGENIKGALILRVNLSGISYSRNGKIKVKHLSFD